MKTFELRSNITIRLPFKAFNDPLKPIRKLFVRSTVDNFGSLHNHSGTWPLNFLLEMSIEYRFLWVLIDSRNYMMLRTEDGKFSFRLLSWTSKRVNCFRLPNEERISSMNFFWERTRFERWERFPSEHGILQEKVDSCSFKEVTCLRLLIESHFWITQEAHPFFLFCNIGLLGRK